VPLGEVQGTRVEGVPEDHPEGLVLLAEAGQGILEVEGLRNRVDGPEDRMDGPESQEGGQEQGGRGIREGALILAVALRYAGARGAAVGVRVHPRGADPQGEEGQGVHPGEGGTHVRAGSALEGNLPFFLIMAT